MGSPRFFKMLVYLALVAGAAWAGYRYLQENPGATDPQRVRQPPVQLPGPQDPYPK